MKIEKNKHPFSAFIVRNKKLTGLFIIAGVLFNYPVISLFNTEKDFIDIPVLYLYLFVCWVSVIIIAVLINVSGHK
jgi:hypothetical protein